MIANHHQNHITDTCKSWEALKQTNKQNQKIKAKRRKKDGEFFLEIDEIMMNTTYPYIINS